MSSKRWRSWDDGYDDGVRLVEPNIGLTATMFGLINAIIVFSSFNFSTVTIIDWGGLVLGAIFFGGLLWLIFTLLILVIHKFTFMSWYSWMYGLEVSVATPGEYARGYKPLPTDQYVWRCLRKEAETGTFREEGDRLIWEKKLKLERFDKFVIGSRILTGLFLSIVIFYFLGETSVAIDPWR